MLTLSYGAANGMDDVRSRVAGLLDGSLHLADYLYLGVGTIVEAASPEPGTKLTYLQQSGDSSANTDGGDQYTGFDRAGNRVWRDNLVAGAHQQDEFYTYDGLYQLQTLDRGNLDAGRTAISGTPSWEEDFTFDPSGNWANYLTKAGGSTELNQNRTHNTVNPEHLTPTSAILVVVQFNRHPKVERGRVTTGTNGAKAQDS